jgi:hypothetical protein
VLRKIFHFQIRIRGLIDELMARVESFSARRAAWHNDAAATLRFIFNLQRTKQCLLLHLKTPEGRRILAAKRRS